MATPFLPAAMKKSTSSSSDRSVDVRRLSAWALPRSARRRCRPRSSGPALGDGRDTMMSPCKRRHVAVVREQGAVLAGGDEIDADGVLSRITARAVLDLEQVAIVLLVALHGDRPRRRAERLRQALQPLLVGKVLAVGSGLQQRLDDLARMAAPLHGMEEFLVGDHPAAAAFPARRRRSRDWSPESARSRPSIDRLIRNVSRSRSSLM